MINDQILENFVTVSLYSSFVIVYVLPVVVAGAAILRIIFFMGTKQVSECLGQLKDFLGP